ncbi:hypothetical protein LCGC14_2709300 [marine sediment metagenome]|uniref:orotate phosphoribosyltransferase n=1 Tax=marine sediment metagenome TaxID=412755 RepID=A0A0F9C547_9ZZZZ
MARALKSQCVLVFGRERQNEPQRTGSEDQKIAYLEGEFELRSGKKSNYYLDKYLFETEPIILIAIASMLADYAFPWTGLRSESSYATVVAGMELGGVALATATSIDCHLPFIIVRKTPKDGTNYGTNYEGTLNSSDKVLLIEDVVTTGEQIIKAAKFINETRATIQRIVAVIDRQQGACENIINAGFEFHALFTIADLGI